MVDITDKDLPVFMNMLEAEPASSPDLSWQPDIPALREQLAMLVSTGQSKRSHRRADDTRAG